VRPVTIDQTVTEIFPQTTRLHLQKQYLVLTIDIQEVHDRYMLLNVTTADNYTNRLQGTGKTVLREVESLI
jgi:hypothetical protein